MLFYFLQIQFVPYFFIFKMNDSKKKYLFIKISLCHDMFDKLRNAKISCISFITEGI